jgi:hypothetical protein
VNVNNHPPSDPKSPRNRLEDEVLEILNKSDRQPSNVVKFQSKLRRHRYTAPNRMRSMNGAFQITGLHLMIAMVVLAILAASVSSESVLVGRVLAILSIACLIALYVKRFVRPDKPQIKAWRGRDIHFGSPPARPAWLDRLMGGPRGPRR